MFVHKKTFAAFVCSTLISLPVGALIVNAVPANTQRSATVTKKAPVLKNTTIIPGKQVGAITKKTKRSDLVKIFGAANLKDETTRFFGGDAEFPGTVINLGKDRSLTVYWKDKNRTQPQGVIIDDSRFKTPEGIGVGTTIGQLRKQFGEFKISGFGWDYGGIPQIKSNKLSHLTLRMDSDRNLAQKYEKEYLALSGDGVQISSNNPSLKRLGVRVYSIIAMFD